MVNDISNKYIVSVQFVNGKFRREFLDSQEDATSVYMELAHAHNISRWRKDKIASIMIKFPFMEDDCNDL